jgi:hypothetical protein
MAARSTQQQHAQPNVFQSSSNAAASGDTRALQDNLHELLKFLASTSELIKSWPESEGDDASIHVETTTKLLGQIEKVITALQRVEGIVKSDSILRKSLQDCLIPMDLLDLLDFGNGLNPDCFSRGLLREALGQLAGLKRRKMALEMLGTAIQEGLNERTRSPSDSKTTNISSDDEPDRHNIDSGGGKSSNKRPREENAEELVNSNSNGEPPLKKLNPS